MASAKLATLIIRTLAKPISSRIKEQARQHERFRGVCVDLAQFMYRSEVKLRTNILGEPAKHIRPLSEAKAIDNGANALAEGFLFAVAAALIIGETWRTSRNTSKRRDSVDDQLEDLGGRLTELTTRVDDMAARWDDERGAEKMRNDELARILERVVEIGLRGGWAEFQDTPLQLPRIQLAPHLRDPSSTSPPPPPPPPSSSSLSDSPLPSHIPESSSSSSTPSSIPTPTPATNSNSNPSPAPVAQAGSASVFVSGSLPVPALEDAFANASPSAREDAPVLTAGSASAPASVYPPAPTPGSSPSRSTSKSEERGREGQSS